MESKPYITFSLEGGLGKHIAFAGFIPELVKKYSSQKIIVMSSYSDIFYNIPGVYRSVTTTTPNAYEDYVSQSEFIFTEPYWTDSFINERTSLVKVWASLLGVQWGSGVLTNSVTQNVKDDFKKLVPENKKLILVQFNGGQSPLKVDINKPFEYNHSQHKTYNYDLACSLVKQIHETYPDRFTIVDYSIQNESKEIPGTTRVTIPYIRYIGLSKLAKAIICIDSSLQHMAAAVGNKAIVIWGATDPEQFGYKWNVNLTAKCPFNTLHCNLPYLRNIGDFRSDGSKWQCVDPTCTNVSPDVIIQELKSQIGG
jgi:hypothetical protein